jgi:hypothetical protein
MTIIKQSHISQSATIDKLSYIDDDKFKKEIHHHLYLKNQLEPLMSVS